MQSIDCLTNFSVTGAAQVKKGDTIRVYYKGTFMDPMREPFDSNLSGPGFTTKIGVGQVIKGMLYFHLTVAAY